MACALIGLSIFDLAEAALPSLTLTVLCALATLAGKTLAAAFELNGIFAIAAIMLPPALVFLWREAEEVQEMVAGAFGSNKAPVDLSEEQA